ncbi:hypothetical protein [Zhongshania aliphaticivorans]|nr:hypothetical protein [Zhongshania aliphaticivorans]
MDLTHGSVLQGDQELLSDVPMYISSGNEYVKWGGCLHLNKQLSQSLTGTDYRIRLRDGRLGAIRIRKLVNTNGALHVELLFEGLGRLDTKGSAA